MFILMDFEELQLIQNSVGGCSGSMALFEALLRENTILSNVDERWPGYIITNQCLSQSWPTFLVSPPTDAGSRGHHWFCTLRHCKII